jgi:hypothetical protein
MTESRAGKLLRHKLLLGLPQPEPQGLLDNRRVDLVAPSGSNQTDSALRFEPLASDFVGRFTRPHWMLLSDRTTSCWVFAPVVPMSAVGGKRTFGAAPFHLHRGKLSSRYPKVSADHDQKCRHNRVPPCRINRCDTRVRERRGFPWLQHPQ